MRKPWMSVLMLCAVLLLAACQTVKPCPPCLPQIIHDTVTAPTPIQCPAVEVGAPTLLLKPGGTPLPWQQAGPAIEHDYRELALFYLTAWPQIQAQKKAPATVPSAPTPPK